MAQEGTTGNLNDRTTWSDQCQCHWANGRFDSIYRVSIFQSKPSNIQGRENDDDAFIQCRLVRYYFPTKFISTFPMYGMSIYPFNLNDYNRLDDDIFEPDTTNYVDHNYRLNARTDNDRQTEIATDTTKRCKRKGFSVQIPSCTKSTEKWMQKLTFYPGHPYIHFRNLCGRAYAGIRRCALHKCHKCTKN
ncbi:hypothetical protein BLOT_016322, partial [Blomia tropicalis]